MTARRVRIATFNCENLFLRFKFKERFTKKQIESFVRDGWDVNSTMARIRNEDEKRITGEAIEETQADIISLQEVENLDALKLFNRTYIRDRYPYQLLIDGNDPRRIDVAVLSRHPFACIKTHQFDKASATSRSFIFSRDCLEVQVDVDGRPLPLFVNHFKSMIGGREETMERRRAQAERVVEILTESFGKRPGNEDFVVLGDLNDYSPSRGLAPLLGQPWLENVVDRLAEAERWTHYWPAQKEYRQLDYVLLPERLARRNRAAKPSIIREGQPRRAERYTGPRFRGVGENHPKASDHCPVAITLEV